MYKLREDLKDLNQDLRTKTERAEREKERTGNRRSICREEIKRDIFHTKIAIEDISNKIKALKEHLYRLISVKPVIRTSFE